MSGFQHHHSSSSGTERCTPPVREAPTPSPSSVAANGGGFSLTAPFVPSTHSHHVDMYGSSLGCDATPFGNGMGETASLYHTAGGNPLSASSPNNNASGYYYMDSSSGYYEMGNTNSGAGGAQQTIGYNGVNGALHHLSSHNTLVPSSSIGPQTTLHGIFPSTSGLQPVGSLNSPSSSCYCTPTTRCANHLHAGGQEDFMCGGPLSTSLIHTNPNNNPPHPHHHHLQHLGVSMFEEFSSSPGAAGGDGGGYQLGTSPGGGAGASTSSLTALGRHPGFQSVLAHNRHNLHNLADGPFSDNEVGAPEKIQTIETLEDLEELCTMLLYSGDDLSVIALDLEGRDLGRNGTLCIITLATVNCVYLIDLISLGDAVLCSPDCRLRDVLESPSILKLMFDCRGDCEALFFVYHIRLAHVCDLQVASCCAHYRSAKHLPSMKTVLTRLGLLSEAEKDIKEGGRNFFSPEMGGSFDAWEERPLHPLLLQYCAVDVRHFFRAYHVLEEHVRFAIRISEERIDRVCAGHVSAKMAVRDFEIPS